MNIWILNDMINKEVFESIIKPDFILKSLAIIVVDLSRVNNKFLYFKPWEIMENIKKWTSFIYDTISNLMLKLPFEKQEELRQQSKKFLTIN